MDPMSETEDNGLGCFHVVHAVAQVTSKKLVGGR
jgi:hypothetical protein